MPATRRQRSLAVTAAAAALTALPAASWAQGSAGTSRMPQTTQTTPQQGPIAGNPAGRAGTAAGEGTTQMVPGNNAGSPFGQGGEALNREVPPHMLRQGHETGGPDANLPNPGVGGGAQAPAAPGAPARPAAAPDRRSDAAAAGGALAAVDGASMRDARRASRVIGAAVYNENNESIGEVDDIVLPANGGPPVVVVSVGGFLGIGAKLVAVPYGRLRMAGERNRWTLTGAASREDLNRLPTFTYEGTAGRT